VAQAWVSAAFCQSAIERQQKPDKKMVFRAEAAFAKPEILGSVGRPGREVCHPHPG